MHNSLKSITLSLVLLTLVACSSASTPPLRATLIPSATGAPGYTLVPIPTHTRSAPTEIAPTPTSPATPVPPTSTSAPASLNPDGPYVVFFGHGGIWISNPDGTFATRLSDYDISAALDVHRLISPTGDRMALVTSNDQGLDLVIIEIPSGEEEIVAHLIDSPPVGVYDPTSANAFATYAIRDYDSLAWQPTEGRLLAFTGAMNGPTADLYIYDTQTREITQLTDGPSLAVLPVWSPDGQYILQYGVRWVPPFGGAIVGANQLDGIWAVRVSDGEVITLPKPEGSLPHFVGWQDDSHYITYDPGVCDSVDLRSIDILTGEDTPIMDNSFWSYIALSPENGALVFSSKADCSSSLGEGVFILFPGQEDATKVLDKRAWGIDWMPESKLFFAYPEALLSSDGQIQYTPPLYNSSFDPAVSMLEYQAWNVIQDRLGHVMVRASTKAWRTIFTGSVEQLIWDPVDGKTLLIAVDDGSIYAATYPDFSPQLMGNLGGGVNHVIWAP